MVSFKIHSFRKNWLWRRFWMMSCCTQWTPETVRWSFEPIILSNRTFRETNGSPTKQLVKDCWPLINQFDNADNAYLENLLISKKFSVKEFLVLMIFKELLRLSLRTDHFVDRIFRGSNWSSTEQLVKGC